MEGSMSFKCVRFFFCENYCMMCDCKYSNYYQHIASALYQLNQKLRKPKFEELIDKYDKIFAEKAKMREEQKRIENKEREKMKREYLQLKI